MLWFIIVLCFLRLVRPEIIPLHMVVPAKSDEISYVSIWLEAQGKIDLSSVNLVTAETTYGDDIGWEDDDQSGTGAPVPVPIAPVPVPIAPVPVPIAPQSTPIPAASPTRGPHSSRTPHSTETQSPIVHTTTPVSTKAPAHVATTTPVLAPSVTPASSHTTGELVHTTRAPVSATTMAPVAVTTKAPVPPRRTSAPATEDTTTAPVPARRTRTPAETTTTAPVPARRTRNPTTATTTAPVSRERELARLLSHQGATSTVVDVLRAIAETTRTTKQRFDIAIFQIPKNCPKNYWNVCDWTTLGIGARAPWMPGDVEYCCSKTSVKNGSCKSEDLGHLMVDHGTFTGTHIKGTVPSEVDKEFSLSSTEFQAYETGDYVVVFANCLDDGLDVYVSGSIDTTSEKGYNLPGELYELMNFYVFMVVAYLLLNAWYWCGMRLFQEASIPIQRFIMATLVFGLIEFFCRALDLGVWNIQGSRSSSIIWAAVMIGVLRRGITRSLMVMVAMGWGVVRDSLGLAYLKIIFLGLLYCAMNILRDFFLVLTVDKMESWSSGAEAELVDLTLLTTLAVAVINLIFFFWILSSLNATTAYLENMNQTTKLRRHLRLRCIITTAFVAAVGWFIFSVANDFMKFLTTNQYWVLEGVMHLMDLYVIACVAILWRPNANAKDYAMQLQLATGDDSDMENELELSCVVPSAEDIDDGNLRRDPDGYLVDDAEMT